ncbi:MAG: membrane dipeptidase [Bulleidia sp.]|nr:membrane dipeptidase [Bulleidia sp.]
MRIFDLHADVSEIMKMYPENETAVLKKDWVSKWNKGEILYTSAASFFAGDESWETMVKTVERVKKDIEDSHIPVITTPEDLNENSDSVACILTVEGMCGIDKDVEERIQWLYDQGNRIGSLEWNDENALATGNSGDPRRGLTEMGKQAIRKMNELHFIVDVSHANEKTFWDILETSSLPVIATHSNAKRCCFVERNLTDQQLRALALKGGLVGLNACASFINEDKSKQDALHLAKHAAYIAKLVGAEHVAVGFDLGEYYNNKDSHNLHGPLDAQNFIEGLKEVGFNEEEIKDIAYRNVFRFLQKYM